MFRIQLGCVLLLWDLRAFCIALMWAVPKQKKKKKEQAKLHFATSSTRRFFLCSFTRSLAPYRAYFIPERMHDIGLRKPKPTAGLMHINHLCVRVTTTVGN